MDCADGHFPRYELHLFEMTRPSKPTVEIGVELTSQSMGNVRCVAYFLERIEEPNGDIINQVILDDLDQRLYRFLSFVPHE